MKNCPMCGESLHEGPSKGELFCISNTIMGHYHEQNFMQAITMYVHPYRLVTVTLQDNNRYTIIAKYMVTSIQDKELQIYQKILTVPVIHPDTEDKLRERIKLILLFS